MLKALFTKKPKTQFERIMEGLYSEIEASRTKIDTPTTLEQEILAAVESIVQEQPNTETYRTTVENIEKLCKARENVPSNLENYTKLLEALEKLRKTVDEKKAEFPWEAVVVGVLGIVQIVVIMNHEQLNVIATKAFGLILKGRV